MIALSIGVGIFLAGAVATFVGVGWWGRLRGLFTMALGAVWTFVAAGGADPTTWLAGAKAGLTLGGMLAVAAVLTRRLGRETTEHGSVDEDGT